jgi:toxin ParE1/3/4
MILLSPDAVDDVERLRAFLYQSNPDAARRALASIWAAIERLQEFPDLDMTTEDPDIRQIVVRFGSSGYIVRYAKAGVAPVHLWSYPRAFLLPGPMGAIGTRLSLRPCLMRGTKIMQGSGTSCREDNGVRPRRCLICESGLSTRHCERREAIHFAAC